MYESQIGNPLTVTVQNTRTVASLNIWSLNSHLLSFTSRLAGGSLDHTCKFELTSDQETVVLEILAEGSKTMKDAAPTTLRALMMEMEQAAIVDATVCCHELTRISPLEGHTLLNAVLYITSLPSGV